MGELVKIKPGGFNFKDVLVIAWLFIFSRKKTDPKIIDDTRSYLGNTFSTFCSERT